MSKLYLVARTSRGLGYQGTSVGGISEILGIYKSKRKANAKKREIWNSECFEIETDLISEVENEK